MGLIQNTNIIENRFTYMCVCICKRDLSLSTKETKKMNVAKYFKTEFKEMWTENFVICFIQIPE